MRDLPLDLTVAELGALLDVAADGEGLTLIPTPPTTKEVSDA